MAANSSFDITTGCDLQEVDNAVNQARKEIQQRYDFKGLKVTIDLKREENKILIAAPEEYKLQAIVDVLHAKMVRRQVPLKNLQTGNVEQAGGGTVRQEISLQQSIPTETARSIVQFIKDRKLKKVQAAIQGEQVRVTSSSKDVLQNLIGLLEKEDFGVELHYGNYR